MKGESLSQISALVSLSQQESVELSMACLDTKEKTWTNFDKINRSVKEIKERPVNDMVRTYVLYLL